MGATTALTHIPADPALPGLDDLVAGHSAPGFVVDSVSDLVGIELEAAVSEIEHVAYRPAVGLTVLWSFEIPAREKLFVSGRLLANERGARIAEGAFLRDLATSVPLDRTNDAPGFAYLSDHHLLLEVFPLDHDFPDLALAASPSWISRLVNRADGAAVEDVSAVEVISYKPGRRCLLRYALQGGPESSPSYLYGRAFSDDRGRSIFSRTGALRKELSSAGISWVSPAPLLFSEDAGLVLLEGLAGGIGLKKLLRRANERREARDRLVGSLARIGSELVRFHSFPIEGLPEMTPPKLVEVASAKAERIRPADAALADACQRRFGNLDEWARSLPPERPGLTHSGFRPSHLVLRDDDLVLLDTDNLWRSGASFDPGTFIAYLDSAQHVKSKLELPTVEAARDAFLAGIAEQRRIDVRWLNWYRAYAHTKSTVGAFLSLDADWPDRAEALLSRADALTRSQSVEVEPSL